MHKKCQTFPANVINRASYSISDLLKLGTDETLEVLDVIDFTSDRKRMSVVVRDSTGRYKLFTKGAVSFEILRGV